MAKKRSNPPSANLAEYRRLRRNLYNRLYYRKKQDFKVNFTTLPKIPKNPTKKDIEKLSKYKIGFNSLGEVIADKPRSKAFVRTDFKGVTPSQLYNQTTAPDTSNNSVKEVGLDYFGMIWSMVDQLHEKANTITYEDIGHEVNDVVLMGLMNAYDQLYRECCDILNENEIKYSEQALNDYYKQPDVWSAISNQFASLIEYTPSNDTQVQEKGNGLKILLKMP